MGSVERFTRIGFETALGTSLRKIIDAYGCPAKLTRVEKKGEYQYHVFIQDTNKKVVIRSSVSTRTGVSASTGEDSIRLWVMYEYKGRYRPLAKLDRWTTRVPGWERRVSEKLEELYLLALRDSKVDVRKNNNRSGSNPPQSLGVSDKPGRKKKPNTQESLTPSGGGGDSGGLFQLGAAEAMADEVEVEEQIPATNPIREPNKWQKKAIEAEADDAVRVMAGPGGGKTFVIERRYLHLVESGVDHRGIYAVTFSKDMAAEALERISKMVPFIKGSPAADQICTIHALCYRILKTEGDRRSLTKMWQVKKALEEIAEDLWEMPKDRPGWKEIVAVINGAKAAGHTAEEDTDYFYQWGVYHGERLDATRAKFDRVMEAQKLLTFNDMVYGVDVMLRQDQAARERWQEKVQYMIIDEGQDTSAQAMRVLATLAAPQNRTYIVGDVDQLMYRFAGATPEANLLDGFQNRYQDGELVLLPVNYRSTREIVDRQLQLIRYNYDIKGGPYEDQYLKGLRPRDDAPQGNAITFQMAIDATAEAQGVADTIVEELANGTKPGDIFVGARTRAQLGYLEGPLVRAKIPFINITGGSFWSLHHIKSVVSYLRLAFDEGDREAFRDVYTIASKYMTVPWRGSEQYGEYCSHRFLGQAFLAAVKDDYRTAKSHVVRLKKEGGFQIRKSFEPGAEDLVFFVLGIQETLAEKSRPEKSLQYIIDNCYEQYLRAEGIVDDGDSGVMDDLATLVDLAAGFDDVAGFLEYVQEAVRQAKAVKDKDWGSFVVISSIHRLKGLERDVVFGIGLCEGQDLKSGEPRGLLPHTFSMIAPPQQGVLMIGGLNRMEDERCIAFVLVSRARSRIYLSGCESYRGAEMHVSRFIEEMGILEN